MLSRVLLTRGRPNPEEGVQGHVKTEAERTGIPTQAKEPCSSLKETGTGSPLEPLEGHPADPWLGLVTMIPNSGLPLSL